MAALDKKTGETVWTTEPLRLGKGPAYERLAEPAGEVDSASYGSPILFELSGRRQVVHSSLRHVFGVDADTGRLLWTRSLPTTYSVIAATPVVIGNSVFITAPDTPEGGKLFQIEDQGSRLGVQTLWTTPLDTCHGGSIYRDGALYGSWYRRGKGWACLDAHTGTIRYQAKDLGMGSILNADERLYYLSQEGEMALIEPTPQGFVFRGRFRLVADHVSDAWTHPVILAGRLYLRYHEMLSCYAVKAE
jgi:outer membrane protein assembly factor BamB